MRVNSAAAASYRPMNVSPQKGAAVPTTTTPTTTTEPTSPPAGDELILSASKAKAHGVVRLLQAGHFKPHVEAKHMAKFGHLVPTIEIPEINETVIEETDPPLTTDEAPAEPPTPPPADEDQATMSPASETGVLLDLLG